MLTKDDTVLVLIDIQGKLAQIIDRSESVIGNIVRVVKGAKVLELPILWMEQYPKGLGPTVQEIADEVGGAPIEKITFSAYDTEEFVQQLEATGRKKVLLAGIETHICVYQTAAHLLAKGYEVEVLADCTSSRTKANHEVGMKKMLQLGAQITSVEMALFEMQVVAKGEAFKEISKIVK